MAFICSQQWPNNKGHVLIIPRKHYENIYSLPDSLAGEINVMARKIAIAMKYAYHCDGSSTRQHNEEHGDQEVWHYHLHVFPRYRGDRLYETLKGNIMAAPERAAYADLLRFYLAREPQPLQVTLGERGPVPCLAFRTEDGKSFGGVRVIPEQGIKKAG